MELILPGNYVEIEEEEMMYLEGGYSINWSRNTTSRVIDVAIAAITRVGIYTGMASSIASFAMTLLNFSVGGAIAYALDRFDRSGLNGKIQF